MEDPRREILGRVARGELTAEEGASLLDELDREGSAEADQQEEPRPAPSSTGVATAGVGRIRIERSFGSVSVIGDPEVREAVAEGPHRAERRGDVLVISNVFDDGGWTFSHQSGRNPWRHEEHRARREQRRAARNAWKESFGLGGFEGLRVRMNPELVLDVLCQAGSLTVQGVRGPIHGEIQAGSASIDDFNGPLDLSLQAGAFRGRGVLAGGSSRIHSEAGSIRLHLVRGSSVTVRGRTTMGRLALGDARSDDVFVLGGGSREMVVGAGEGTLDLDSTMGSVRVTAD
jgi:hypothetical protein